MLSKLISKNYKYAFYLNGEYFNSSINISFLNEIFSSESSDVFLVDAGIKHFNCKFNFQNKIYWIGDFDSSDTACSNKYKQLLSINPLVFTKVTLPVNKNISDFAAALEVLNKNILAELKESPDNNIYIEIYGALGGRKDHELINLLEINTFIRTFNSNYIIELHPNMCIANCPIQIKSKPMQEFSIGHFLQNFQTDFKIENALYDGIITLTRPSHGLSNKSLSNYVNIIPNGNSPYFVIFN